MPVIAATTVAEAISYAFEAAHVLGQTGETDADSQEAAQAADASTETADSSQAQEKATSIVVAFGSLYGVHAVKEALRAYSFCFSKP